MWDIFVKPDRVGGRPGLENFQQKIIVAHTKFACQAEIFDSFKTKSNVTREGTSSSRLNSAILGVGRVWEANQVMSLGLVLSSVRSANRTPTRLSLAGRGYFILHSHNSLL